MDKIVVYIGGFELPDKNAAAHRVLNNAKILRELGYTTVFIETVRRSAPVNRDRKVVDGFETYSIYIQSGQDEIKLLFSISQLRKIYDLYKKEIVAVIAYDYPAIALERIRLFCKKKKISFYADITEWYCKSNYRFVKGFIKNFDTRLRMHYVLKKADALITISKYLYNYYSAYAKCAYIPPLVDLSEEKWKNTVQTTEEGLNILYAGSPGIRKDKLNCILRALVNCDVSNVKFNIIGIDKETYLSYYPEDVSLVNTLDDVVNFLGRKSHLEVIEALKKSDFSLFYRDVTRITTAGFPTKFAESIACGIPVITNKTSNLPDYLVEGVNGFWIDDIETDLKRILAMDIKTLKNVKNTVQRDLFDYHHYIDEMRNFIDGK